MPALKLSGGQTLALGSASVKAAYLGSELKHFNAKAISGLGLWLDASDASTLTLNSGNVSELKDKSGNGRNATQETALNQPAYESFSGGGNAVEFLSSNRLGFDASFLVGVNYTLFLVAARTTSAPNVWLTGGARSNTNQNLHVGWRSQTDFTWAQFSQEIAATVSGFSSEQTTIVGCRLRANGRSLRLNGSQIAANEDTSQLAAVGGQQLGYFPFLSSGSGSKIGEVIAYNRELTDAEVTSIESYLARKWGVAIA